ncbi:MAG: hypothetical protein ACTSQE_07330 [Candidatus Heimdallarchaeaceae archaeon]
MNTPDVREKPEVDLNELDELKGQEEETSEELEEENLSEIEEDNSDDVVEEEEETPPKPDVDYKEKFANSTREAQVLAEQKKKLEEQLTELTKPKVINDDYMKDRYPDWEDMTDMEKRFMKKQEVLDQKFADLNKKTNEFNNDRKWRTKTQEFASSPENIDKYPALKSQEAEFIKFSNKPSRKGLDMDTLAKVFSFEAGVEVKPKKKKTLFSRSSGPGKKPVKKGYSAEEVKKIRTNSPRKYNELVRTGKIKIDL